MKTDLRIILTLVLSALMLGACGHDAQSPAVAVIDLSAVAAATGEDEKIRERAEEARNDLVAQLQQVAMELDQQLIAEREKLGETLSEEDELRLQQLNLQARQQLADVQAQVQAQAAQIEQNLVTDFRDAVAPLAEEVAKAQGAQVILAQDAYLFWYEPALDITDEVIAAWRARPEVDAESEETEQAAEAQADLEAVDEELAQTEDELAEAEEQIEVLEEVIEDVLEEEATTTE
jgi:Skp family chaperone for outer membrane proteins